MDETQASIILIKNVADDISRNVEGYEKLHVQIEMRQYPYFQRQTRDNLSKFPPNMETDVYLCSEPQFVNL